MTYKMAAPMESPLDSSDWTDHLKESLDWLQARCSGQSGQHSGGISNEFMQKATAHCAKLTSQLGKISDKGGLNTWLQLYSQAVLDITFVEENQLVDEEFPQKTYKKTLLSLIGDLSRPEQLVKTLTGEGGLRKVNEVLGEEITECLYWRRGALLYMCCSTLNEDEARVNKDGADIIQYCQDGVRYLRCMQQVRSPLQQQRSEVTTNDENVYEMLKHGLFSDTHVLALMYSGELCYWGHQMALKHSPDQETREQFISQGSAVLQAFIKAAEGPLKPQGWNTSRAKELLTYFRETPGS